MKTTVTTVFNFDDWPFYLMVFIREWLWLTCRKLCSMCKLIWKSPWPMSWRRLLSWLGNPIPSPQRHYPYHSPPVDCKLTVWKTRNQQKQMQERWLSFRNELILKIKGLNRGTGNNKINSPMWSITKICTTDLKLR